MVTGRAQVSHDGEHIVIAVPSGADRLEIALSVHHAARLGRAVQKEAQAVINGQNARGCAEVIDLAKRRKKARRR